MVLAKYDEYMLMLWCGSNAALSYAGGIVVSPKRTLHGMPLDIEQNFRDILQKYDVDYDYDMFPNDNTSCPE